MGSANGCNIGNLGDVALGIAPSGTQKVRKKTKYKKKEKDSNGVYVFSRVDRLFFCLIMLLLNSACRSLRLTYRFLLASSAVCDLGLQLSWSLDGVEWQLISTLLIIFILNIKTDSENNISECEIFTWPNSISMPQTGKFLNSHRWSPR